MSYNCECGGDEYSGDTCCNCCKAVCSQCSDTVGIRENKELEYYVLCKSCMEEKEEDGIELLTL